MRITYRDVYNPKGSAEYESRTREDMFASVCRLIQAMDKAIMCCNGGETVDTTEEYYEARKLPTDGNILTYERELKDRGMEKFLQSHPALERLYKLVSYHYVAVRTGQA